MKLELLGKRILVEVIPIDEKTKSGLYVPTTVVENSKKKSGGKAWKGKILQYGKSISSELKEKIPVGTIVYLAPESIHCPSPEEDKRIILEEDIIAVEE